MNSGKKDEVRKILLSLLLSRTGPTILTALEYDYVQAEGKSIPWRELGYTSLVAFLKSMPESFLLKWNRSSYLVHGIASDKSKHVSSLVSRQKTSKRAPSRFLQHSLHIEHRITRIPAEQFNLLVQFIKEHPSGITISQALNIVKNMLPYLKFNIDDLQQQLRGMEHQLYLDGNIIRPHSNIPVNLENTSAFLYPHSLIKSEAPDNNFEPSKVTYPVDHTTRSQDEWNPATFKHTSGVIFDVPSDSDSETFGEVPKSKYCDDNATFSENVKTCKFNTNNDLSELISEKVQLRLKKLVEKYSDGIPCANLPELYLREYNVPLNYTDLGFSSVRAYASYLPNIFYMKQPRPMDDFILYSADQRSSDQEQIGLAATESSVNISSSMKSEENLTNIDDDEDSPFPSDLCPDVCEVFQPEDAMFDGNIGHISVIDLQNSKKPYLEVYVVDVFTPSFFWIQLRKNVNRLNKLMCDLNNHYEKPKNRENYRVPRLGLKRGLHCVCQYINIWHRAIIKSVKPDYKVTVLFYDYGSLKTLPPEEVYYLNINFSRLPSQAIACSLYNVKPYVGDRWKKSITDRFIDKIAETLLAATIMSVDPQDNSMSIILTDTSEEEDIHINDWLIKENLAQKGKMDKDGVDMSNIMNYVLNKYNEMPTYCYAEENLVVEKTKSPYEHNPFSPGFEYLDKFKQDFKPENIPMNSCTDNSTPNITSKMKTFNDADAINNKLFQNEETLKDSPENVACSKRDQEMFKCIATKYKQNMKDTVDKFINNLIEKSPDTKNILNCYCWMLEEFQIFLHDFIKPMEDYLDTNSNPDFVSTPNKFNMSNGPSTSNVSSSTVNVPNVSSVSSAFDIIKKPEESNMNSASSVPSVSSVPVVPRASIVPNVPVGPSAPIVPSVSSIPNMFNILNTSTVPSNPCISTVRAPPGFFSFPNVSTVRNPPGYFNSSNVYDLLRMPNMANMFNMASVTSMPSGPKITSVASVPSVVSVPSVASVPSMFSMPRMPNQHSRPSVPRMSSTPNTSNMFNIPNVPNMHNMHNLPIIDGISNMPNVSNNVVTTDASWISSFENLTMNTPSNQCRSYQSNHYNDHTKFPVHNTKNFDPTVHVVATHNRDSHLSHNTDVPKYEAYKDINQLDKNVTLDANDNISNPFKTYNSEDKIFEEYSQCETRNSVKRVETNPFRLSEVNNMTQMPMESNHEENNINNNPYVMSQTASIIKNDSYFTQSPVNICKSSPPLTSREQNNQQSAKENESSHEERKCDEKFKIQGLNSIKTMNEQFTFWDCDNIEGVTLLFHWQDKGWILMHEFVKAFINISYSNNSCITFIIQKLCKKYKEIHRSTFPDKFLQLDRKCTLDVDRDSENRIISITLISLREVMEILQAAKMISLQEVQTLRKQNKSVSNPFVMKLLDLFRAYYSVTNI